MIAKPVEFVAYVSSLFSGSAATIVPILNWFSSALNEADEVKFGASLTSFRLMFIVKICCSPAPESSATTFTV